MVASAATMLLLALRTPRMLSKIISLATRRAFSRTWCLALWGSLCYPLYHIYLVVKQNIPVARHLIHQVFGIVSRVEFTIHENQ